MNSIEPPSTAKHGWGGAGMSMNMHAHFTGYKPRHAARVATVQGEIKAATVHYALEPGRFPNQ